MQRCGWSCGCISYLRLQSGDYQTQQAQKLYCIVILSLFISESLLSIRPNRCGMQWTHASLNSIILSLLFLIFSHTINVWGVTPLFWGTCRTSGNMVSIDYLLLSLAFIPFLYWGLILSLSTASDSPPLAFRPCSLGLRSTDKTASEQYVSRWSMVPHETHSRAVPCFIGSKAQQRSEPCSLLGFIGTRLYKLYNPITTEYLN